MTAQATNASFLSALEAGQWLEPGSDRLGDIEAFAQRQPHSLDKLLRKIMSPSELPEGDRAIAQGCVELAAQATWRPDLWGDLARDVQQFPVLLANPISLLIETLDRCGSPDSKEWILATLLVRDCAEAIARTIWLAMIHDALEVLDNVPALAACESGLVETIQSIAGSLQMGFTLGAVQYLLTRQKALEHLATQLEDNDKAWTTGLPRKPSAWMGALERIRQWRNTDLAHGLVGNERRFAGLFAFRAQRKDSAPFEDLLAVLSATQPWLIDLGQRTRHWACSPTSESSDDGIRHAEEGLAWHGEGEPLWVLERSTSNGTAIRGIVSGRRVELPEISRLIDWAARASESAAVPKLCAWSQGPTTGESRVAQQRAKSRFDRLSVPALDLVAELTNALQQGSTRVVVHGSAGCGKSWLLEHVRKKPPVVDGERIHVVLVSPPSGRGLSVSMFVQAINRSLLKEADVYLPNEGTSLLTAGAEAAEWWREFAEHNSLFCMLILLDGMDEAEKSGDSEAGRWTAVLPPQDLDNINTLVAYRNPESLSPTVRAELDQAFADATRIDLDAYFQSRSGEDLLVGFVRKRFQVLMEQRVETASLPAHVTEQLTAKQRSKDRLPLVEALVAASERRFLWLHHYARGFEQHLFEADRPEAWPQPSNFYSDYIAALLQAAGNHPVYTRVVRRVLMMQTWLPCQVDDNTLAWIAFGEDGDSDGGQDFSLSWLRPVLADLDDFLYRFRVDVDDPEVGLELCAAVLRPDVHEGATQMAWVRRPAHAELVEFLSNPSEPAWIEELAIMAFSAIKRVGPELELWLDDKPHAPAQQRRRRLARLLVPMAALHRYLEEDEDDDSTRVERFLLRFWKLLPSEDDLPHQDDREIWTRGAYLTGTILSGFGDNLRASASAEDLEELTRDLIRLRRIAAVEFKRASDLWAVCGEWSFSGGAAWQEAEIWRAELEETRKDFLERKVDPQRLFMAHFGQAGAWFRRGRAYRALRNFKDAAFMFEHAKKLLESSADLRGRMLHAQGRHPAGKGPPKGLFTSLETALYREVLTSLGETASLRHNTQASLESLTTSFRMSMRMLKLDDMPDLDGLEEVRDRSAGARQQLANLSRSSALLASAHYRRGETSEAIRHSIFACNIARALSHIGPKVEPEAVRNAVQNHGEGTVRALGVHLDGLAEIFNMAGHYHPSLSTRSQAAIIFSEMAGVRLPLQRGSLQGKLDPARRNALRSLCLALRGSCSALRRVGKPRDSLMNAVQARAIAFHLLQTLPGVGKDLAADAKKHPDELRTLGLCAESVSNAAMEVEDRRLAMSSSQEALVIFRKLAGPIPRPPDKDADPADERPAINRDRVMSVAISERHRADVLSKFEGHSAARPHFLASLMARVAVLGIRPFPKEEELRSLTNTAGQHEVIRFAELHATLAEGLEQEGEAMKAKAHSLVAAFAVLAVLDSTAAASPADAHPLAAINSSDRGSVIYVAKLAKRLLPPTGMVLPRLDAYLDLGEE